MSAPPAGGEAAPVPVRFEDLLEARRRLEGVVRRTPLLSSPLLDRRLGGRLLVKAECLQETGSFKLRGAYNAIAARRPRAVVAYSSGNHAQGVARAAALHGIPATIVMPGDAPELKRRRTEAFGAEVVVYDRMRERREAIGARIAREQSASLVPPYDDPLVIAGQGTVGLEIAEELLGRGMTPDLLLCPCGGGGLIAGVATAMRRIFPDCAPYCVEPEGFDDHRRSLEAGRRIENPGGAASICDALLAPAPGAITFAINRRLLAGGLAVSDVEVAEAMRVAFAEFKLVLEPGGAVALAALLAGRVVLEGRTAVVVLSGGNVDPALFARILADSDQRSG